MVQIGEPAETSTAIMLAQAHNNYKFDCQLINKTLFPQCRCIPLEEATNASIVTKACHDSLPLGGFVYVFLNSYSCINDITEQLHDALISTAVSPRCEQVLVTYYCNYIYPGCNPNITNQPIGICHENCNEYLLDIACSIEFNFLENLGETTGMFSFPRQCENTLRFVLDSGLNVSMSDDDDHDDDDDDESCKDISGIAEFLSMFPFLILTM